MKQNSTSRPSFDAAQIEAAMRAAPPSEAKNPVSWANAIPTYGGGVEATLNQLRRTRGAQRAPLKVPTTIRFDADVLAELKASGRGWQTRVNDAMRAWLKQHAQVSAPVKQP